jgi:hypothetical protein
MERTPNQTDRSLTNEFLCYIFSFSFGGRVGARARQKGGDLNDELTK